MANVSIDRRGSRPTIEEATITIASAASSSQTLDMAGKTPVAIYVPAITNTAITFNGSNDDSTYSPIYDHSGNEFTITLNAAAGWYPLGSYLQLGAFRYLQIVGSVNEAAERSLIVALDQIKDNQGR